MYSAAPSGLFVPSRFNILPPKGSTRILMPVPEWQWREPSAAQEKDQFGNADQTRFFLRARLSDGHILKHYWWFDDRADADAFFYALLRAQVMGEPIAPEDLRLPTPWFDPDLLDEPLSFELVTSTFLTSGATTGTSIQSYLKPVDWNNGSNTIVALAGGASGARSPSHACGGGGGGCSAIANLTLTGNADYQIGGGALGAASSTGNNGGNSFFDGTTVGGASVSANGGTGGIGGSGSRNGGAGGAITGTVGGLRFAGGQGGNMTGGTGTGASGGGGAAGTDASGLGGNNSSSTGTGITTAGGSGNGGTNGGGTGGAAGGTPGGNGTNFDATHGSGGGSSGDNSSGTTGGNYGGGSGGYLNSSGSSPLAAQGLIWITYAPLLSNKSNFLAFFN